MIALSVVIFAVLVGMRIAGITTLGPWGVASTFAAVGLALTGVNLFAVGVTFNYLVSLFHKRPVRQGLFGKPIFKRPLERQFWWMGLLSAVAGLALSVTSLVLSFSGWQIERLWLYLLGGTGLFLLGIELGVFWIIVGVLDELKQREIRVRADMESQ
jgi:hypothetical protein